MTDAPELAARVAFATRVECLSFSRDDNEFCRIERLSPSHG